MFNQDLLGGTISPIWLADTQQQMFNSLMQVMSRPGRIDNWQTWQADKPAYLAVLATLLDAEVSLHDCHQLLSQQDWPLLQVKPAEIEDADYLLCSGSQVPHFTPKLGTLASPDFAATLIIQTTGMSHQAGELELHLQGPGIQTEQTIYLNGVDSEWIEQRNEWCSAFPLGVDLIFVADNDVMCLPRTTRVQVLTTKGGE